MSISNLTAVEIGALIKEKKLSAPEAAQEFLSNIEKREGDINAFITVGADDVIERAKKVQQGIDKGEYTNPLAGVPMAMKDNIRTSDMPTTCGSLTLEKFVPPYNATVYERLMGEGAVLLGKLNMDEFAMGGSTETSYFGKTKNPWDTERVPGGSSGGSAAAIAAGEAAYTLGTDTGGSIRQPCSYCGVTGIKPTYGAVSRYGAVAFASSLDQIGPIGKDIVDCAKVLSIISGADSKDSTSIENTFDFRDSFTGDIKGMKIGVPTNYFCEGIDDDVKSAVEESILTYEKLGAVIKKFEMPIVDYAVPAYYVVSCAEASSNMSRYDGIKYGYKSKNAQGILDTYVKSRSEGFGMEVKRRIMLGSFVLSSGYYDAYYKKALKVRRLIKNAFDDAFKDVDIILSPTTPTTAFKIGENISDPIKMYLNDIYTASVNLTGLPAVAYPCGGDVLPIGAQLIGRAFDEPTLVKAAYVFQQNTDFHKRGVQSL